jgi:hypothetical protein
MDSSLLCLSVPVLLGALALALIVVVVIFNYLGEQARVKEINSYRAMWGDFLCDLLIKEGIGLNDRVRKAMSLRGQWPDNILACIVRKQLAIDMTEEMVALSWGSPNNIEQKQLTKKGVKTRWTYGTPRRDARYVWFTDGCVTKIES